MGVSERIQNFRVWGLRSEVLEYGPGNIKFPDHREYPESRTLIWDPFTIKGYFVGRSFTFQILPKVWFQGSVVSFQPGPLKNTKEAVDEGFVFGLGD